MLLPLFLWRHSARRTSSNMRGYSVGAFTAGQSATPPTRKPTIRPRKDIRHIALQDKLKARWRPSARRTSSNMRGDNVGAFNADVARRPRRSTSAQSAGDNRSSMTECFGKLRTWSWQNTIYQLGFDPPHTSRLHLPPDSGTRATPPEAACCTEACLRESLQKLHNAATRRQSPARDSGNLPTHP